MEFNYAIFTEEWAQHYSPMKHIPGEDSPNRRFYICDSYMTMTDFMSQMEPECSPCVIIESQQEGTIVEGWDYPDYGYYFMARADISHDGHEAIRAKSAAKRVMMDFVNFVRMFKYPEEYGQDLTLFNFHSGSYLAQLRTAVLNGERIMENLDIDNIRYDAMNEMYDGWYGISITLGDKQVFSKCPDITNYV